MIGLKIGFIEQATKFLEKKIVFNPIYIRESEKKNLFVTFP